MPGSRERGVRKVRAGRERNASRRLHCTSKARRQRAGRKDVADRRVLCRRGWELLCWLVDHKERIREKQNDSWKNLSRNIRAVGRNFILRGYDIVAYHHKRDPYPYRYWAFAAPLSHS